MKTYTLDETIVWAGKFLENKRKVKRKKMNDIVTRFIKTYTPIAVGALVAWLLTLGVQVDVATQAGLIITVTGLLQALYYAIAIWLAHKWPKFEILLGSTKTPEYK